MTNLPDSKNFDNPASPAFIFEHGSFATDSYCEAHHAPHQPRKHWQPILAAFQRMGSVELKKRQVQVKRLHHEHGATFNPFGDFDRGAPPWQPDLIPFLIPSSEWAVLERGLVQRARLLNLILSDVYGPQQLLRDRRLPPELIFANPRFLQMLYGIKPPVCGFLAFYAADVLRSPDGRWFVLSDFSSNPAGLGYALDNRIVVSRVLSHLYHQNRILRLAPFFSSLQQLLTDSVQNPNGQAKVIILSPGPGVLTYFEHAFLSRYLGYPLVQSQDLTVRKDKVFIKKLGGLEPVDAILRCLEDVRCDPMAMRSDPEDGVAGLFHALRQEKVAVINPVGSGYAETPALQGLLPGLCRHMLGEELLLPNHPFWWCGDPESREHVLAHLEDLLIRPTWNGSGTRPVIGRNLSPENSSRLREAILARPYAYAAIEPITPSFVPAIADDQVSPRYAVLRMFLCASSDGYTAMPGALARIASSVEPLLDDSVQNQGSKDVWVLSDKPVEQFSLLNVLETVSEFSRGSDLPSRVAEHLLWLGRYLERAEGMLRLVRSVLRRLSGELRWGDIPELPFLLYALADSTDTAPALEVSDGAIRYAALEKQLLSVIYDRERSTSIFSLLKKVQDTAQHVNDRLSLDSRRVLSGLEQVLVLRSPGGWEPVGEAQELLNELLFILSAFSGLAMESMTRGLGWRFMDMGRRIERALNQINLIQKCIPPDGINDQKNLEALLEVSDSIMTYISRYRSAFQFAPVLDLLLVDESNPKSLAFQLLQLAEHVKHLPHRKARRHRTPEEEMALEMLNAVRRIDLNRREVVEGEAKQLTEELTVFLETTGKLLATFAQQITASYLSRVPAALQFSGIYPEPQK